mmetsp:Transcript_9086/g.22798  ORF Transcript_9086/g.22798 Transcript_9086/m.22798 type:complete len:256 (+) Transcript_9086:1506-2273(+)
MVSGTGTHRDPHVSPAGSSPWLPACWDWKPGSTLSSQRHTRYWPVASSSFESMLTSQVAWSLLVRATSQALVGWFWSRRRGSDSGWLLRHHGMTYCGKACLSVNDCPGLHCPCNAAAASSRPTGTPAAGGAAPASTQPAPEASATDTTPSAPQLYHTAEAGVDKHTAELFCRSRAAATGVSQVVEQGHQVWLGRSKRSPAAVVRRSGKSYSSSRVSNVELSPGSAVPVLYCLLSNTSDGPIALQWSWAAMPPASG